VVNARFLVAIIEGNNVRCSRLNELSAMNAFGDHTAVSIVETDPTQAAVITFA